MEYRQMPAPADLAPWVECAWILRGGLAEQGQVILPDGRIELVFHFAEPPLTAQGRQANALIAGRMREALELLPNGTNGAMDTLGVRLRPGAAGSLVPCEVLAPVSSMEAVLGHWASEVRERLGNVRNEPARVALLWRLLRNRLTRSETPDAAVQHSVQLIESARGQGPIENFMPSGVGERQWQRRFLQSSGFSPKAFARITRLQYLIRLFESGPIGSWADLAIEAGFYDQSHLVNEFRSFSGQSPEAYFQAQRGMAEFYHDGNFQDNIRERE